MKQIFAANPRTIEVLRSSFPYAIVWSQQNLPAIVHMTHNSQEEGHGLADVLFGDYSPAGRLTQTWPTGDAQLLPHDGLQPAAWTDVYVQQGQAALRVWLSGSVIRRLRTKELEPERAEDGGRWQRAGDGEGEEHGQARRRRGGAAVCAASGLGRRAAATGAEGVQAGADRAGRGAGRDD